MKRVFQAGQDSEEKRPLGMKEVGSGIWSPYSQVEDVTVM